jgi:hypothetical protein
MPRFLVQHHYYAQVVFDYIVDAEDDEEAIEIVDEERLEPFRLQYDKDTLRLMDSDPIEVREIENDGETTPEYWDCECEKDYIHSKTGPICDVCGALAEDQPDSRLYEIPQPPRKEAA